MSETSSAYQSSPFYLSPFHLTSDQGCNEQGYQAWKAEKLNNYPRTVSELIVPINNPYQLTTDELSQLRQRLTKTNMAIYALSSVDFSQKAIPEIIGHQLGIRQLDKNECADNDSFSSIQVVQTGLHNTYIPYSNKPLNWHTDGYYNKLNEQIYTMVLHCVRKAHEGGLNQLMDFEIVYLLLRDQNPDYIRALMAKDAMLIPKNILDGKLVRPDRPGPVFSISKKGRLHMRYTARARNVFWKDNEITQAAQNSIRDILNSPSPFIFEADLQPGQGLICNNVLHTRSTFTDDKENPRLLYRGRYLDKIDLS